MTTPYPPPTAEAIEEFLLSLVARDRGVTVEFLRQEQEQYPHDPPWSSEDFVHYQEEIETVYGIDFDPEQVEKVQRHVARLAAHIQDLITASESQSA